MQIIKCEANICAPCSVLLVTTVLSSSTQPYFQSYVAYKTNSSFLHSHRSWKNLQTILMSYNLRCHWFEVVIVGSKLLLLLCISLCDFSSSSRSPTSVLLEPNVKIIFAVVIGLKSGSLLNLCCFSPYDFSL